MTRESFSYVLGRAYWRLPLLGRLVPIAAVVGAFLWLALEPQRSRRAQDQAAADVIRQASLAAERARSACLDRVPALLERYALLIASKKPREAADALKHCAGVLNDKTLVERVSTAEVAAFVNVLDDTSVKPRVRLAALDELTGTYPAEAARFAAQRPQLAVLAERAEKQQVAESMRRHLAERKREGVSIGMSSEEVLQSSWGRPESVNRTVFPTETREQWVYGHNYLYFTDGKLMTIQTAHDRP